jgi:hypothetical protein
MRTMGASEMPSVSILRFSRLCGRSQPWVAHLRVERILRALLENSTARARICEFHGANGLDHPVEELGEGVYESRSTTRVEGAAYCDLPAVMCRCQGVTHREMPT